MQNYGKKKKPGTFLLNYMNEWGIWRLQTKIGIEFFPDL
jgi:hypothetical protein